MSSSEAYLDSLLAALSGEKNQNDIEDESVSDASKQVVPEKVEEEFEEPVVVEEAEPEIVEAEPEEVVEEPVELEEEESIEIAPVSDDPNKALGADEIAALFAQANVDMETGEETEPEEETVPEETVEEPIELEEEKAIEITPVSDDPNKALGADEIAALFAQANVDMETGEESEPEEEPVPEEPIELEEVESIEITPVSDDPNKALGADEIAALFAQANVDMETGEETEPEMDAEDMSMSLDDMLAGMLEDAQDDFEESPASLEEIEIDMDNPEELELLLGIGDKKDRVQKVPEESSAESEDDILAAMGEDNPDLNEINSLLNKLDNNELVGDGIEESVLVGFDESEYDSEQDPWLDELLGGGEDSSKKKKDKKKMKLPFFGRKKKDKEPEVVRMDEEDTIPAEDEEIQDILSAMSQDDADIPLDLFADMGGEEGELGDELDLIAMVEADEKKEAKKADSKKGFFAKIFDALTEEIPEDEEEGIEEKKEKKEKKAKKGKKGKAPVTDAEDNEGILEELDAEEKGGKKKKKEKKPKKEKKAKKQKEQELPPEIFGEKKLPIKMVIRIFALCFSIMALLLLVMHFVPKMWSLADGRNAFYKQDYEKAYEELTGKELSEADQRLYEKSKMILQLSHKMDAYENYKEMNLPVEALDALLSGYMLWQELGEKISEYDAVSETEVIKAQIVNALSADYQITEEEAAEINLLGNYEYTLRLEEITGSLSRQNGAAVTEEIPEEEEALTEEFQTEEMTQTEETPAEPTEDVLSEEEVK